jgi:endonuclease/exonuclease/phosphatase (EEP) superfamily protein YafD
MSLAEIARKLRRPARLAWLSAAGLAWLLALVGLIGRTVPYVEMALQFAAQLCWTGTLLAAAALLLRRWRHVVIAGALALWQLWVILPGASTPTIPADASGHRLHVVELNAWIYDTRTDDIVSYLRNSNADFIGLVEVSPHLKEALTALFDRYPYHLDCVGDDDHCEEMLLSRLPLTPISASRIDGKLPVVVGARLQVAADITLDVAVSHVIRPLTWLQPDSAASLLPGTAATAQSEQAAHLAGYLAKLGPDAVFLGDLNAAPWTPVVKALRQAGGWHPETEISPTWPSWASAPARLPIDHVLTRGKVVLTGLAAGPVLSSDHLPLEAEIFIPGKTPE